MKAVSFSDSDRTQVLRVEGERSYGWLDGVVEWEEQERNADVSWCGRQKGRR